MNKNINYKIDDFNQRVINYFTKIINTGLKTTIR